MPETTAKMMTRQETFNKAYLFILKQGKQSKQSMEGLSMCQYRGPNNAMCAAGCLIDDQHYSEDFESCALGDEVESTSEQRQIAQALALSGVAKEDLHMVREMQIVHDGLEDIRTGRAYRADDREKIKNDFVTHWKAGCAVIAAKYGLTIPEVPA